MTDQQIAEIGEIMDDIQSVISQFGEEQDEVRDLAYKLKIARVRLRATAKYISESNDFSRGIKAEAQAILDKKL